MDQSNTSTEVANMQVRIIPFDSSTDYVPIGQSVNLNGQKISAINNFIPAPSGDGLFFLAASGGKLKWIGSTDCEE
jgi:hypothetical protein